MLLLAAAIPQTLVHPDQDARNFATIVILALSLPVVTLLAAVTRVSASVRDRRLAALRIIGVSAATTRAVAAIEAALLSAVGSVFGVLGFLAVRPVAADVARKHDWFHGRHLTPSTLGATLAIGAVIVLGLLVAVLPARSVTSSPLAVRRQAAAPRPRWWRLGPLLAGLGVLTYSVTRHFDHERGTPHAVFVTFFVGTILTALGLPLAAPVAIRLLADAIVRVTTLPSLLLAARRMQQEPAGTNRLVTSLLVALFVIIGARCVLVPWETTPQAIRAERAMTRGPQAAQIEVRRGQRADLAAISAVPGVTAVAFHDTVALGNEPGFNQAVVARCADLPALRIDVPDCVDGRPIWLRALSDPDSSIITRPVTLTRRDVNNKIVAALPIGRVATVRDVQSFDPHDPNWDASINDTLLIPPGYPHAAAFISEPREIDIVLARGGPKPLAALTAAAAAQGLTAFSNETPEDYQIVQNYRAILYSVAAVLLMIGLAALLITALDAAVQRRRHLAALAIIGVPLAVSRHSQLVQVAVPLLIGLPIASSCGLLAGRAYLQLDDSNRIAMPWTSTGSILGLALLAGLVVAALTVPGLGRAPHAEDLRRE